MLSAKELADIDALQEKMRQRFLSVGKRGKTVRYLGKTFIVFKNVFWPFEDSVALAKSFAVHSGERVLDVGTGSGVLAIFSAYKRAGHVVAVDSNPNTLRTARENARRHNFSSIIEVRKSDVFSALKTREKFDVVIANPPFRNRAAKNIREAAQWDTDFSFHKKFFSGLKRHLSPKGRVYIAQANYGDMTLMKRLARRAGLKIKRIGIHRMPKGDPRVFYAFELSLISR